MEDKSTPPEERCVAFNQAGKMAEASSEEAKRKNIKEEIKNKEIEEASDRGLLLESVS
jgi:hypothetical protein